jgi:hypothetical protein
VSDLIIAHEWRQVLAEIAIVFVVRWCEMNLPFKEFGAGRMLVLNGLLSVQFRSG